MSYFVCSRSGRDSVDRAAFLLHTPVDLVAARMLRLSQFRRRLNLDLVGAALCAGSDKHLAEAAPPYETARGEWNYLLKSLSADGFFERHEELSGMGIRLARFLVGQKDMVKVQKDRPVVKSRCDWRDGPLSSREIFGQAKLVHRLRLPLRLRGRVGVRSYFADGLY